MVELELGLLFRFRRILCRLMVKRTSKRILGRDLKGRLGLEVEYLLESIKPRCRISLKFYY